MTDHQRNIENLMLTTGLETPLSTRLSVNAFPPEELRKKLLSMAPRVLAAFPRGWREPSTIMRTQTKNRTTDTSAEWNNINATPAMIDGAGAGLLIILLVDAYNDLEDFALGVRPAREPSKSPSESP